MTVFGYRLPMMSSLLVWCVIWEIVGRLELVLMFPPFTACWPRWSTWCRRRNSRTRLDHHQHLLHRHGAGDRLRHRARRADGARQGGGEPARHVGERVRQRAAVRTGAGADDPVRHGREDDRRHRLPVRGLDHRARHPRGRAACHAVADRHGAQLRRQALAASTPRSSCGPPCRRSSPASASASSAASRAW